MTAFLGLGWRFPIRVNARGGLDWAEGADLVAQSIWIILSTPVGRRVMQPEFGCDIHSYVFASNTANTRASIASVVERALLRYEPRIDVLKVRAETSADGESLLFIHVDYRIRANNAFHNLVYPFYLSEGEG
ncbi:GPW/gp25 family protein [Paenirhodobacter sp.]|uniref:GPW/gp25 family protein n=1 Tax=Paenirhodobacter sp. TaxID=1965326 RepID=UPI003B50D47B